MIKINFWKKSKLNNDVKKLLKDSFGKVSGLIENQTYILSVVEKNKLLGTISLLDNDKLVKHLRRTKTDEELAESFCLRADPGIFIFNLAVNKKFRGKGIAKKLVDASIYMAKLKRYKYCHVHCENEISFNIFKKKKFSIEKKYKFLKKDITLMSKWLN
tara:strand:- start:67 stop:543 length:477 start_codon:yes stop_codon:yes gene_type:complete